MLLKGGVATPSTPPLGLPLLRHQNCPSTSKRKYVEVMWWKEVVCSSSYISVGRISDERKGYFKFTNSRKNLAQQAKDGQRVSKLKIQQVS